jgi:hypothetical protein
MRTLSPLVAVLFLTFSQADAALVTFSAMLSGSEQPTPNSSPATGTVLLTLDTAANTYDVNLSVMNLDPATLTNVNSFSPVHIHQGGPGTAGPVLSDLGGLAARTDFGSFGFTYVGNDLPVNVLDPNTQSELLNENTYINVHTSAFNGGEIRGQLTRVPTVSAVPEPGAMLALSLGAVGLAGYQIRRYRATRSAVG